MGAPRRKTRQSHDVTPEISRIGSVLAERRMALGLTDKPPTCRNLTLDRPGSRIRHRLDQAGPASRDRRRSGAADRRPARHAVTGMEPADLRQVERADVYLEDELVGSLERGPADTISFDDLPAQDTPQTPVRDRSVAWSLLRSAPFPVETTGGAVPPFFAGLLPEGVRLGVLTSSTKTSPDDHLTLLLAVGADTIGNVRVAPTGHAPPKHLPMFDPDTDTDFSVVFTRLTGSLDADPVALAGVDPRSAPPYCRHRPKPAPARRSSNSTRPDTLASSTTSTSS